MSAEIICLKDRVAEYQETIKSLQSALKSTEIAKGKQKESYEAMIAEMNAIIKELKNKVAHAAAIAERNDTNTGIPTAATPINGRKVIPNTRRGSNKTKGGQVGHKRHTLAGFDESEITDIQEHRLDLSVETCHVCHGELTDTEETESKDEFDVKVTVVKHRHEYSIYECADCGARVRLPVDRRLKEANQYGSTIQAAALSFMVTGNVAINKVRMLINGMTAGEMNPSEGFISKLYKRASQGLEGFIADLKQVMIQRTVLYWDDTVIMIQTQFILLIFYSNI